MPELALVYLIGTFACGMLTTLFVFLWRKRRASPPFARISRNLRGAGYYWSENLDRIVEADEEVATLDAQTTQKTMILTGALLSLLSWAGAFFLFVIMISYRFLARSRMEKLLLASPLASEESLAPESVRNWLKAHQSQ